MRDDEGQEIEEIPIPGAESETERQRIRSSNDHDQELEREGETSRHNRGYDQAVRGERATPDIERVVDEE